MITFSDVLISDFTNPFFQEAFKQYFSEMAISLSDWDGLFREMNDDSDNLAFVRTMSDGQIIGFIQFQPAKFTNCFFEETCGFIRDARQKMKTKCSSNDFIRALSAAHHINWIDARS